MTIDHIFAAVPRILFTPFSWLLRLIGTAVQPIAAPLDSVLVKIVLLIIVLFALHHHMFDRRGNRTLLFDINTEFKLQAFPWTVANLLAMCVTASGPYGYITGLVLLPEDSMKMTFFNFMEWGAGLQLFLVFLLIIGVITTLWYYAMGGIKHAVRFLLGMLFSALVGSVYIELRIGMGFVADEFGGIIRVLYTLLDIVLDVVVEGVVPVVACVALPVWILPTNTLIEMNREREAKERAKEREEERYRKSTEGKREALRTKADETERFVDVIVGGSGYTAEEKMIRGQISDADYLNSELIKERWIEKKLKDMEDDED